MNRKALATRIRLDLLEDRVTPTTLPAGFTEALVTTNSNLSSPTAMEISPTGQIWVLEQGGRAKLVRGDGTTHTALTLTVDSAGERGLLGIAFDPAYDGAGPNTDFVYLYYTTPRASGTDPANNRFTVSNAGTTTPTLGSEQLIRELPPEDEDNNLATDGDTNHNGGAIHFGPDGKLYSAVGDHNYDTSPQSSHVSQITSIPFGKMLRINPDGSNPTDNPFYNGSATNWEGAIWAMGLRNPYTFAFQPGTGTMFINDVAESAWEEINFGEKGVNYGWAGSTSPLWEGFESPPPSWANYRDPIMAYDHSNSLPSPAGVAITGGAFYPANSQFGSAYAGKYFFADFGANFIRVFDSASPGSVGTPDTSTGFASALTTGGPVDLKVDAAGSLYYLARGGVGEIYRISFQAPIITQHPTNVTVDAGQPASFSVTASGVALSYQWQKLVGPTWTDISGATASTYSIATTTPADAGDYRVIVSNSAGSATSNPATLTVNVVGQAPNITQQPANLTVNVGESASFTVTANGTAPLSYQWQKFISSTWTDIAGATAATFTIQTAATTDAGQYRVVVSNLVGTATSNAATLTVNQFPTATISAPDTYTFGQTIDFSGTATDPEEGTLPASAYTWRVDFGHENHFHPHVAEFSGATGGSFVANFNEPDPDQFYRIVLTVKDSNGATFTTTRDVLPVKVQLTLASSPVGVPLTIDGQPVNGPLDSVVGIQHTIQAPPTATIGGSPYAFSSWSDGGAITHTITTPSVNAAYTANYSPVVVPFGPGLTAEFFDFTTSLSAIPNFTGLTPDVSRIDSTINYPNTAGLWPGLASQFQDTFAARHTGYLRIDTPGSYTLYLRSNDGSKLYLDGDLIIDNDGVHGMRERSAVRTLSAGYHALRTEFFENAGGAGLVLLWRGPGIGKQVIPPGRLSHDVPPTPRAFRQDAGSNGLVVMEAEHYDTTVGQGNRDWTRFYRVSGFSGDGAVQATPNTGAVRNTGFTANSPRMDFRVNFTKTGTHYVWVRGRASSTADDTLHVGLDGAAVATADKVGPLKGAYGWTQKTVGGPVATIEVGTPGIHTVNVWMREDGAVVDRLLLSTNAGFIPTGTGPAESPRDLPALDFSAGFSGATGLTANGSAGVVGSVARLTSGGTNQAGSLFSTNAVGVEGFATMFDFQLTSAAADGFAFVIQGAGNAALGTAGGGLGYQGIGTSVDIKFDLQDNAGEGNNSTGLFTNGEPPTVGAVDLTPSGINLHSGHVFRVSMAYVGLSLSVTIRDLTTGASAEQAYTVNIPALVGGNTAYVGFTAGTGTLTAVQDVLNWTYWG